MLLQSIIVYTFLITIMVFSFSIVAKKEKYHFISNGVNVKNEKYFWRFEILFPLLLFATIFGMRYDVGVDHLDYLNSYLWKIPIGKKEPLFFLLSEFGWKFNLHYTIYFGIIAFIQVTFFFYAFKNEKFLLPFLVFFLFTNGTYSLWMNIMRQSLAMCIWLFSIKYIEEKKPLKYILWCIIAIMFHRSAIILLLFYPILRNGKDYFKNIKVQLILIIGAFIFKELFYTIIMRLESVINIYTNILGAEMYENYNIQNLLESFNDRGGTGIAFLFKIALNIIIILYSRKLKLFYNNKRFIIIYFFFFFGLLTTYIFPEDAISFTRPFRYFYVFQTIMYGYFTYFLFKTRNTKSSRLILFYGILAIFSAIFYLSQITSDENSHLWYQFYFQQNINGYPNRY